jgi:hypothetical protein
MRHIPEWQAFFRQWMLSTAPPGGSTPGPALWMPVENMESREDERIGGVLKWSIFAPPDTGQVEAFIDCESALEVIGATIALDLLEGTRFEACGWCRALFEVTKENGRQYCNQDCAHRAGQKRRRAAAKALRARKIQEPSKPKRFSKS